MPLWKRTVQAVVILSIMTGQCISCFPFVSRPERGQVLWPSLMNQTCTAYG